MKNPETADSDTRREKPTDETLLAEISGRNFSDTSLWVRRDVEKYLYRI